MCESCEKSCGKLTEKNISRIINICDKKGADIMGSNIFLEDIKAGWQENILPGIY